jgi:apolipoprotein N-acyltransferase
VPFGEYLPHRDFLEKVSPQFEQISVDMWPSPQSGPGIFELPLAPSAAAASSSLATSSSAADSAPSTAASSSEATSSSVAVGISPTPAPAPSAVRTAKIGALICFEIFYDELIAELADSPAELIYLPSSNVTFGRTSEAAQQIQAAKIAAISSGRAVLIVSTTGISGLALPNGEIRNQTKLFERTVFLDSAKLVAAHVPASAVLPVYNWFLQFLFGWACLSSAWIVVYPQGFRRRKLEFPTVEN